MIITRYACSYLEPPYDDDRKHCKVTASTEAKIKEHEKRVHHYHREVEN